MSTDRENQDKYDVIQAQEEFDSMLDPRTAALQEEIRTLKGNITELYRMLAEKEAIIEELKDYKWMYEELQ